MQLTPLDNYESLAEEIATSGVLIERRYGTNGMDEDGKPCICCGNH